MRKGFLEDVTLCTSLGYILKVLPTVYRNQQNLSWRLHLLFWAGEHMSNKGNKGLGSPVVVPDLPYIVCAC